MGNNEEEEEEAGSAEAARDEHMELMALQKESRRVEGEQINSCSRSSLTKQSQ